MERIRPVVVAGGDDDFLAVEFVLRAGFVVGVDDERAVVTADLIDGFVEPRFDSVVFHGAAIIVERLGARGLPRRDRHGQVADFHALGRGEERHVDRIVVERIAEAALVDDERAHAGALGFDGAGETGGPGADADNVVGVRHRLNLGSERRRGGTKAPKRSATAGAKTAFCVH